MFALIRKLFIKRKDIAFIDGDQDLDLNIFVYKKYLLNTRTIFIRQQDKKANPPRKLKSLHKLETLYLNNFSKKKEIVDKCIAIYIHKVLTEGYNNITVVSSDYDFIDIFRLIITLETLPTHIKFRLIIPNPIGKTASLPDKYYNIEVVKIH